MKINPLDIFSPKRAIPTLQIVSVKFVFKPDTDDRVHVKVKFDNQTAILKHSIVDCDLIFCVWHHINGSMGISNESSEQYLAGPGTSGFTAVDVPLTAQQKAYDKQ
jgi:hypothetical protein